MQIYLPIAELSVNIFLLLGLGGLTGVLAGIFGVGGGFLLTPLLIFIGVSPAVAVSTSANQIIAASFSGFLAHMRRGNVDFRMGNMLLGGGLVGSTLGVFVFRWLRAVGQIDLIISLAYVLLLGTVGILMAIESTRALRGRHSKPLPAENAKPRWRERLPLQMHFPRSNMQLSVLLPVLIGFAIGALVSLMGVGGGFFLVPAMIYLFGMPTSVVIGTSLYQTMFITANATLLQALTTQTVDIALACPLLIGAVLGAQFGARVGVKLSPVHLRGWLAAMVLIVSLRLAYGLFATPDTPFVVVAQ